MEMSDIHGQNTNENSTYTGIFMPYTNSYLILQTLMNALFEYERRFVSIFNLLICILIKMSHEDAY